MDEIHSTAKHGCAKRSGLTGEYMSWRAMKRRCDQASSKEYLLYGGRGIKVCDRWLHSFSTFLLDMGARPSKKHTLDRIDKDGDYQPSNCRWATRKEQARNTRTNHLVTFQGKTLCINAWSEQLGIPGSTIRYRLRSGWPIAQALTCPPDRSGKTRQRLSP